MRIRNLCFGLQPISIKEKNSPLWPMLEKEKLRRRLKEVWMKINEDMRVKPYDGFRRQNQQMEFFMSDPLNRKPRGGILR